MKKNFWIAAGIIVLLAILFTVFYKDIKHLWLPSGQPSDRPVNY